MGFKTMNDYNEERTGKFFTLRNDGDHADVVFLYRGTSDVLVADSHYIKSSEYSGYVHCCGKGCPACGRGISVRTKLFIPLYNYSTGIVEFWDRNTSFENQLLSDVFSKYPNPSEYVFRITRNGAYRDMNTTYKIVCAGLNNPGAGCKSYETILAENNIVFPDYYSEVIREYSQGELYTLLNAVPSDSDSSQAFTAGMPNYQVSPRRSTTAVPDSVPPQPYTTADSNAGVAAPIPAIPFSADTPSFVPGSSEAAENSDNIPEQIDEEVKF